MPLILLLNLGGTTTPDSGTKTEHQTSPPIVEPNSSSESTTVEGFLGRLGEMLCSWWVGFVAVVVGLGVSGSTTMSSNSSSSDSSRASNQVAGADRNRASPLPPLVGCIYFEFPHSTFFQVSLGGCGGLVAVF